MRRVAVSLVILPVLLFGLLVAVMRVLEAAPQPFTYDALAGVGPLFIFATFFVMGCVAVPLMLLATWRRWVSIWHALVVGVFSGLFAITLPIWPILVDQRLHLHFRMAKLGEGYPFILLGAAGGAIFWLLALYRNPSFRVARNGIASGQSAA